MKRKITLILILLLVVPILIFAQNATERVYHWYAEEKLTISSTAVQLSSEEYDYLYGATKISVKDPNSNAFVLNEVVTENTTKAMGLIRDYSAATSPSWLEIEILYNGLDSADC